MRLLSAIHPYNKIGASFRNEDGDDFAFREVSFVSEEDMEDE